MSARPPSSPVAAQTSTVNKRFGMESDCGIGGASAEMVCIWTLVQLDSLDVFAGEEQLDHPVAQYSNLAFQTGQFPQINAAPQQPGEQSAEAYGLPACEGNPQFSASRMMADHAERAQRIEMKWFQCAASQSSPNISSQHTRLAECELRSGRTWIASLAILERRAIAHGPHSRTPHH